MLKYSTRGIQPLFVMTGLISFEKLGAAFNVCNVLYKNKSPQSERKSGIECRIIDASPS